MATQPPTDLERELARAHLLITRGDAGAARALLDRLRALDPGSPDIVALQQALWRRRQQAREADDLRRGWRYRLGLQTWAARAGWLLAALAMMVYALWNGTVAVQTGLARGFGAVITTQVYRRYSSSDWTRPVYVDLAYSFVVFVSGLVAVLVVRWASKGAAQWEELDVTSEPPTADCGDIL